MKTQIKHMNRSQQQSSPIQTYADLIINYLVQIDVDYIFGVPGGGIEPLYNAIARQIRGNKLNDPQSVNSKSIIPLRKTRSSPGLQAVIARHEAGAAFMADGYARETGKLGVCCATTGPGATNLITGVAAAYTDRVPMLVITPQTALPDFGKLGLQESSKEVVDTVGMFEHCTHYNTLVSHPNQLEGKLYTALINAFRHPRGPVHLSIPMDIMNAPVENSSSGYRVSHLFRQPEMMDEVAYNALVDTLLEDKRVVLFIGGGCKTAINHIMNFAEHVNAEIVSTPSGKRWMDAYHPLYRGVFGFAGHKSAFDTIMDENVDHILAIGTSLGELSTSGWNKSLLNDKLIHVAETPEDFARSPMAQLHVFGDLRTIFRNLHNDITILGKKSLSEHKTITEIKNRNKKTDNSYIPQTLILSESEKCFSDASPLKPQRVMRELSQRFPSDTRFITDAGNAWAWTTHYLLQKELGTHRVGFGFGAMAWAIGAAVGTALGNRKHPVICITGDGSFLMSGQEITTAVAEKLPVIFAVLNDQALGMVKHGQRLGGAEPIGFELPPVDFAKMAEAMGANGYTLRTPKDFEKLDINILLKSNKPTLLDIYIDPEEVPPIGARVQTLSRGTPKE